jgi:hypothetical protein
MNYFNKLPIITYDNKVAVNILARAKLSDQTKSDSKVFLPYTLSDGDRMDMVSQAYYGNPGYTWLIWYANETIDPYYETTLSEIDLQDYIITKYGSIETSQRKIAFYRTNGHVDDRTISVSQYTELANSVNANTTNTMGQQKYWDATLDYLGNVKEYIRKNEPQELSTNRIVNLNISNVMGNFKVGEEVQYTGTNYGFCTYASNTQLTINNTTGTFLINTTIVGRESNASATVTANNTIATTQAYDQPQYWEAVSFYDYEVEQNEKKKEILLLDSRYTTQIEQELKRTMAR